MYIAAAKKITKDGNPSTRQHPSTPKLSPWSLPRLYALVYSMWTPEEWRFVAISILVSLGSMAFAFAGIDLKDGLNGIPGLLKHWLNPATWKEKTGRNRWVWPGRKYCCKYLPFGFSEKMFWVVWAQWFGILLGMSNDVLKSWSYSFKRGIPMVFPIASNWDSFSTFSGLDWFTRFTQPFFSRIWVSPWVYPWVPSFGGRCVLQPLKGNCWLLPALRSSLWFSPSVLLKSPHACQAWHFFPWPLGKPSKVKLGGSFLHSNFGRKFFPWNSLGSNMVPWSNLTTAHTFFLIHGWQPRKATTTTTTTN